MAEIFIISSVWILIIILIKKKVKLSYSLFLGGITLGLLSRMSIKQILKIFHQSIVSKLTLELMGIITLILILVFILEESGFLSALINSISELIKDARVVSAVLPAVMGFLAFYGGAIVSAPMVKNSTEALNLTSERKAFINFWFRHIWYYIYPLFPGLILASKIADVNIYDLALRQIPLTVTAILCGILFGFIGTGNYIKEKKEDSGFSSIGGIIKYSFPIVFTIFTSVVLKFSMIYSLLCGVGSALVLSRIEKEKIILVLRRGIYIEFLLILLSILFFKNIATSSGAMKGMTDFLLLHNVPLLLLISIIPFIIGIILGTDSGAIGVSFPVFIPIISSKVPHINYVSLLYTSAYLGYLVSPVHLCLALTREYFNADMAKMYKFIIPSIILVFIVALLTFLIL